MNLLVKKLIENQKFQQYVTDVKGKISPISLSGLSDVGKSHIIIATIEETKKPILILTYNEMQAKKIMSDLRYFIGENSELINEIVYIPKKEISPYDYVSQSKELSYERIEAFNKVYNKHAKIIVTTIESIMQKSISKDVLYKNIVSFKVGQNYIVPNNKEYEKHDLDTLKEILVKLRL